MENQDTNNIYKLYKEGFDDVMSRRREAERGGYKDPYEYHENPSPSRFRPGRPERGSEYSLEVERDGHRFVINLVKNGTPIDEYRARSSERPGEAKIAATKYFEQKHNISIDDGNEENAEDAGGGSMRGYMADEIVSAFEGDGEMDIFELDDLARKYFGGGEELDDMSQDDMVDRIGDALGLDLEVHGDRVMLADYRN
jgi:hypothetical protein